jgi:succinyldiaminopimelate transaminase
VRVRLSPVLTRQTTYPFVRLEQAKRNAAARGIEIIDFGQGDPREPTDPIIQRGLLDGLEETMGYPKAEGLPELREAIAGWIGRRYGIAVDPDGELIPTLGSKEAIFSFAQVVVDAHGAKDTVVVPDPAYPVYERGAEFAGARVVRVPLRERHGFLPEIATLGEETLERTALVWVNYPNNPTAASAPRSLYEELADLADRHDFLVCSDEAYSELWFEAPPSSALEVEDRSRVVVFNTLSKRSSMTGYRSGFLAAAPGVIEGLRKFRPTVGTAPQEFVQRASIVAWEDEQHVEAARARYRRKRDIVLPAFERLGWRAAGKDATMYLWLALPEGEGSEAAATHLLEHGIVVAPGVYLGASGEGYVRVALVPTVSDCERAVEILEDVR